MVQDRNVRNENLGQGISSIFEGLMLVVSAAVVVAVLVAGMMYFQKLESEIAAMV